MFYKKRLTATVCSGILLSIVGCGGSDSPTVTVKKKTDQVPELNELSVAISPLSNTTQTSFAQHLKNGIYLRNSQSNYLNEPSIAEADSSSTTDAAGSRSGNFSSTTTQEQGVGEADRIKYDGNYLFIANNNYYAYQNPSIVKEEAKSAIKIMERAENGDISELAQATLDTDASNINGLYLNSDILTVLASAEQYYYLAGEPISHNAPRFNISFVDVSTPENTNVTTTYHIDGNIVNSRRVGNILYVVSRYQPYIEQLPFASTDEEKIANYTLINNTDIETLLPKYQLGDGVERSLVNEDQCLLPDNATQKDGYDTIMTLTAIDITDPQQINSVCVNTSTDGLYATENSIYVYGTYYNYNNNTTTSLDSGEETSIIHKFAINDMEIDYVNSASLAGRFNWHLSNLRFSEQGDYLRVVTTSGNGRSGFEHKLNILLASDNEFSVVNQLPNATNVTPIGKVSDDGKVYEDIKAVRFFENNAYIVTFLTIDPLYVIDLSDNNNPKIAGALEIPGYSAYLHPISDGLLLGIGQNIDENRIGLFEASATAEDDKVDTSVAPVIEGAKVSLFDVSDITAPREIQSIVYENGYTPVEYDYKALSHLVMENGDHRFALPIERWKTNSVTEGDNSFMVWQAENFLSLIEVSSANETLKQVGNINANDQSGNSSSWDDRSIIHNDDVYYIHGNQVWRSYWQNPELISGPF